MCCEVLRYTANHIGGWFMVGFSTLTICLLVFMYFYGIAAFAELIKCSITRQKPKLTHSEGLNESDRSSDFCFGVFGLSLLLLLPASGISLQVVCGLFIVMGLSMLGCLAVALNREDL